MPSTTAFFDAFGSLLFGRAPRTARAQFKSQLPRADSISALREAFGLLVPDTLLCPQPKGRASRQRLFSPLMTFWVFLSQVLSPNSACRDAVRKPKAGGRCDTNRNFSANQCLLSGSGTAPRYHPGAHPPACVQSHGGQRPKR